MKLHLAITLLLLSAACDKDGGEARCPEPGASTTSVAAASTASVDGELVRLAGGGQAIKFKLRVDDNGTAMKQSLYHSDATGFPEPVLALARERFAGAKIERYESELYADLGRIYEVELTATDGRRCEVAATAEGKEHYTECRLTPEAMPAPIRDAIAKLYPEGKVIEVETKTGPTVDEVTVEVQVAGGGEHYVRLAPDGKLIARYARVPAVLEVPLPMP
ncbi:MAG: hypothetical protein H7138_21800 [Myxococcales bacterium]|nr:hypothetical protein [Myxococcales bacterium]